VVVEPVRARPWHPPRRAPRTWSPRTNAGCRRPVGPDRASSIGQPARPQTKPPAPLARHAPEPSLAVAFSTKPLRLLQVLFAKPSNHLSWIRTLRGRESTTGKPRLRRVALTSGSSTDSGPETSFLMSSGYPSGETLTASFGRVSGRSSQAPPDE
jgi:hypothetical protein